MTKTRKGERTRARIVDAALELFREKGYDETTMRAVAEKAGVSLGNAYYYFSSKEHLLQAYYGEIHRHHVERAQPVLARERGLKGRLLGVMNAMLEVIEPFHRFSGLLFKTAGDPRSPLNPFNEETRQAREESTALFAQVLEGAKVKLPKDVAAELPDLLWTYSMGIVLFWIHDDSPGRRRTHALVDRSVELIVRMISMFSNPLLLPIRKSALRMIEELRETE